MLLCYVFIMAKYLEYIFRDLVNKIRIIKNNIMVIFIFIEFNDFFFFWKFKLNYLNYDIIFFVIFFKCFYGVL